MKRLIERLGSFYFSRPITLDTIVIVTGAIYCTVYPEFFSFVADANDIKDILSNVISTIVSFTGFILASLTIIVTFKANVKIKDLTAASNALELLLSTNNYKEIVGVFRDAIIELVISLAVLYISWIPVLKLTAGKLVFIASYGILVVIITISRTLFILFKLIFLEFKKKSKSLL